jgi:hypothetical protein
MLFGKQYISVQYNKKVQSREIQAYLFQAFNCSALDVVTSSAEEQMTVIVTVALYIFNII